MTCRSLIPVMLAGKSGQSDPTRTFVLTGMERHVYPNPSRALRTAELLYIRNFDPAGWNSGEVEGQNPTYDFSSQAWPTGAGAFSFNIDPSPSKQAMRHDRGSAASKLSFGVRPREELYDLKSDPDQLRNIAGDPERSEQLLRSRAQLEAALKSSQDPRSR